MTGASAAFPEHLWPITSISTWASRARPPRPRARCCSLRLAGGCPCSLANCRFLLGMLSVKTKIHVLPVREGNDEMDPKNGGASIKAKSRKGRPWKGRRTGRSRCMGYGSTMSARGTGGRWVPDAGPCRAPRTGGVVGQRELTEERGRRKQRAQGQGLSRAGLSRPGPLPGEGNDLAGGMVSAQPRAAPPQRGRRSC